MRPVRLKFKATPVELFFYEKAIELLQRITIDSYRLRLHNPKSLLIELQNVITDLEENRLKNKTYADTLIEELQRILKEEKELKFNSIKKEFFESLLNKQKRDDKQISYTITLLLKDNNAYIDSLSTLIEKEIVRINGLAKFDILEVKDLNRLILYFLIEIKNLGYSKSYLNRFITSIFNNKGISSFNDAFIAIKSLIARPSEEFIVILAIDLPDDAESEIKIISTDLIRLKKKEANSLSKRTNSKIQDFLSTTDTSFYKLITHAKDFYSATQNIRDRVYKIFDVMHMGHSKHKIGVRNQCAVIGTHDPKRADIQNFHYKLDGYYKSHQRSYEAFLKKLSDLKKAPIDKNSLNKIYSGMRYLRLGSEALELENQLLNYWIGIEYIFSIYDAESHTVSRLRLYYKKCHAYIYLKRLMYDFHKSIENFKLTGSIPGYNSDLNYLNDPANFDIVIAQAANFPLLAYRAHTLKAHLSTPKIIIGTIEKHQQNLDWNINRIYRIRNEIVHNAGNNLQIETIVSHLRYYLIFILNSIIEYFLNHPFDITQDKILTLDDFFIMREVQVNNISYNEKLCFQDISSMSNPTEYLS